MAKKILIVDDALETLALLEAILQGQGYSVVTSSTAKEAITKAHGDRPDLIMLDVLMPEMDGFALFKALKNERAMSTIPVLILTVRSRMEDTFRALGAEEFLPKPVDAQRLLEKIKIILGESEATDASQGGQGSSATATAVAPSVKTAITTKRIFVLTASDTMAAQIKNSLSAFNPLIEIVSRESQAISKLLAFKPDIIVMDVLFNDRSAADLITKFKQIPNVADKPIILFSFLDKERMQGTSVHQRASAIELARTACLKAGANEAIGGFEENRFVQTVKKYL